MESACRYLAGTLQRLHDAGGTGSSQIPVVAILRAEDQWHIVGMAGDSDFAAAALAYTSNFFHDGARGVGQLGRTGRKRTASANSYDNLVFLTVDGNETLADFLPQGDP